MSDVPFEQDDRSVKTCATNLASRLFDQTRQGRLHSIADVDNCTRRSQSVRAEVLTFSLETARRILNWLRWGVGPNRLNECSLSRFGECHRSSLTGLKTDVGQFDLGDLQHRLKLQRRE